MDTLGASMSESLDELYTRWRTNPDVAQTVALCDALRGSRRPDLVEIVGSHAAKQLDVGTLTAAARMYADTGRFEEAQQVLVAAGRLAPRDGEIYRWLGEVLLRRGDAERAEKVLERAVTFGSVDPTTALLTRARALLPKQRSSGMTAVAADVALHGPTGAPTSRARASAPRVQADSLSDDVDTLVRGTQDVKVGLGARPPAPLPAAGRPLAPAPAAPAPAARPAPPLPPPPASVPEPPSLPSFDDPPSSPLALGHAPQTSAAPIPQRPILGDAGTAPIIGLGLGPESSGSLAAAATSPPIVPPPPYPVDPPLDPFVAPPPAPRNVGAMPEARDVLEALQIAGIFEPDGAIATQGVKWDKPEAGRRRIGSFAVLVGLFVAIVGGGAGAYFYVTDLRAKKHVQAEELLAKVDTDLRLGDPALLEPSEDAIGRAFELESRSTHAAKTWLHERVMLGLLRGGAEVSLEGGLARAREVEVEERDLAFAVVASFLFQGDTAGAAAAIAKWDEKAANDAFYQLVAGATFERAGDERAAARYEAAAKLAPDLFVAQTLLVRAVAMGGDPARAAELAKALSQSHPTRAEGPLLEALAWARNPARGDAPDAARKAAETAPSSLPITVSSIPHALRALFALDARDVDRAKKELELGLASADAPSTAAWLGSIALATGDEVLARKGALAAVSYSAAYPPARVLAARVALLGARLDEALKAAEDLPPASGDVAAVTAAVAYEKLDGELMSRALDALASDAKKLSYLGPIHVGQALLAGDTSAAQPERVLAMAKEDAPWADLVAMDAALDTGDLELARKVATGWLGEPRPLRALRLARLARYEGKAEEADRLSKIAIDGSTVTARVLAERVFSLVAAGKAGDALALFKQHPNAGGPLAKWLRAYATASNGKIEEARAILSQQDPPPALAPAPARTIAAAAYGAAKDTRHGREYVRELAQKGLSNPDVLTAAERVGVATGKRR